jgi:hypothetical protein
MNALDPKAIVLRAAGLAESKTMKSILTPDRLTIMGPSELHQILTFFIQKIATGERLEEKNLIQKDIDRV